MMPMLEPLKLALLATANCTFARSGGMSLPSGRGRLVFGSLSQIHMLTGCRHVVSDPCV